LLGHFAGMEPEGPQIVLNEISAHVRSLCG
jgi:hypothetical protein